MKKLFIFDTSLMIDSSAPQKRVSGGSNKRTTARVLRSIPRHEPDPIYISPYGCIRTATSLRIIMQRTVLDRSVVEGFRGSRVESMVSTSHGRKLFVATNDGAITAYTCSLEMNSLGRLYMCKDPEVFRKVSKDKKSVAPLLASEVRNDSV